MRRGDLGQLGFADGLVSQRAARNEWLADLDKVIDWSGLLAVLDPIYKSDCGRPSYPLLTLLKLLLVQQWYGLSDPGLEEAVDDRLSFRRFAGIPLDQHVPDHSTLWRFRQKLVEHGLDRALFDAIHDQLAAKGLMIKRGTLIDATIIKAAVRPPAKQEGSVTERDPQAGWAVKNEVSTYGYKGHIGVDEGSNLIRGVEFTSGDFHDSQCFAPLVQGDEQTVYADKAYGSQENRTLLKEHKIGDGLMYRAHKGTPLKPWQDSFNKAASPVRCAVERPFGLMKRVYGYVRARYIGLARNACQFRLICMAVNLRRALVLTA
jgi:transposase, IS5 family